jgi:diacylglycerol kinase family enzyme
LLVNPGSGDGTAARTRLAEAARDRGIDVAVLTPGENLSALVRNVVADGADALGVAGGDGSLALVAAVASEEELPFVCVPAGTRNHFARDIGVDPHDPVGALDAFTDGLERRIDVGDVNGRLFLNNVSLGVYGDAVREPTYRDAKRRTLLETARRELGPSATLPDLDLVDDLGREYRHPAVVLVSNNPYVPAPPLVGTRSTLDSGRLGIIVLEAPGRTRSAPGHAWSARSFEVDSSVPVAAGIDGEAVDLVPPLLFVSRPAALRVRISSRHQRVSPPRRRR